MICRNCGKELTKEDRFCSRCGSKVENLVEQTFEEVVFNPPFKIENEIREDEKRTADADGVVAEKAVDTVKMPPEAEAEEPSWKKFDTIDFTWDLTGFPSEEESEKKSPGQVVFDWTSEATKSAKEVKENDNNADRQMQKQEDIEPQNEDVEYVQDAEIDEEANSFEVKAEEQEPFENNIVTAVEEDNETIQKTKEKAAEEQMQEYFDDGMPKGNGITVEDFLEELKNHVPKEERMAEEKEAEPEEETEGQNLQERIEQGRRGLKSFFRGAFLEPEIEREQPEQPKTAVEDELLQEENEDTAVTEATQEVEEEVEDVQVKLQEAVSEEDEEAVVIEPVQLVAVDPCCVSPITVEAPAEPENTIAAVKPFEEIDIQETEKEETEKEETEKEEIENLQNQEINEFLPEDKQESGTSETSADATRIVDKFYTFNKKNVEFQKLLDQEYDKIRGERPIEDVKAEVKQSNKQASDLAKETLEKKEAVQTAGQTSPKEKLNWDEIFGDVDDIEEKPHKKGGAGKVLGVLLLIIVLAMGGAYGVMKLLPGTEAAVFIEQYYDKGMELLGINSNEEPLIEDNTQSYIDKQIENNKHIGEVIYDSSLMLSEELTAQTQAFKNEGYVKIDGEETNYGEMITAALISHYSAESGQEELITRLAIGDFRAGEGKFYVPCEIVEAEKIIKEVVTLSLKGDNIVIDDIEQI